MIVIKTQGSYSRTFKFLRKALKIDVPSLLKEYGKRGVDLLSSATPVDSGLTSESWGYAVKKSGSGWILSFTNSNIVDGVPIAIILQYGHATGTGGYVQGRDYINPAIQPLFDNAVNAIWEEVYD